MGIVLYRVDERLIHGQVTVGWGSRLRVDRYVVVDDDLEGKDWERELYALGTPAGACAEFLTVVDALLRLPVLQASDETVVLLTRDVDHMVRLASPGGMQGESVNLGGIHHREGRDRVLSYLCLDERDREHIRALERAGVDVRAQELPGTHRTSSRDLLDD